MPENAYRLASLRSQLCGGTRLPWLPLDQVIALRRHPDWPLCTAGCGWPVDPASGATHPGCEPDETTAGAEPADNPSPTRRST